MEIHQEMSEEMIISGISSSIWKEHSTLREMDIFYYDYIMGHVEKYLLKRKESKSLGALHANLRNLDFII